MAQFALVLFAWTHSPLIGCIIYRIKGDLRWTRESRNCFWKSLIDAFFLLEIESRDCLVFGLFVLNCSMRGMNAGLLVERFAVS